MRINHNIQALNAYRNLYQNQSATAKNLEKLSSGLRINRAADDAAGLAISEKMRSQIRGLNQAETNSLDGVSLMQVAEGAMTEVHSMLQRMRELTVQAANDTNTLSDREAIQLEIDELLKEIDSIADKTEFNTRRLLDGSSAADAQYIVGEIGNTNIVEVPVVKDAEMESGTYAISVTTTPKIVNTLNQPGAGISQSDVISFKTHTADVPAKAGTPTVNTAESTGKATVANLGTLTAAKETDITVTTGLITYTPASVTGNVTEPSTVTLAIAGTAGAYTIEGTTVSETTTGSGIYEYNGFNIPATELDTAIAGTGDLTINASQEFTFTPASGGTVTQTVNYNSFPLSVTVDGLNLTYTNIADAKQANQKYSIEIAGAEPMIPAGTMISNLPLGEYTITVSGFNQGKPANATIEIFGPDGFSIGSLATTVGADTEPQFQEIGTMMVDVRQITQAGTAKVQLEAEMKIEVSKVEKTNNAVTRDGDGKIEQKTPITFEKTVTTRNGKVNHGGLEMTFDSTVKQGESAFDLTNKSLTFQIGANTNQSLNIDVPQLSTVKLGINGLQILSHEEANRSLHKIDQAITAISATRAKLGATQNRLEHTISNLQVTAENLTSAESRIRDADMAKEMTDFTKNNILNQSAQAMLAQANQLPQGVLQLLQG